METPSGADAGLPGQMHYDDGVALPDSIEKAKELAQKQRDKLNEYKNLLKEAQAGPGGHSIGTSTSTSTSPMLPPGTLSNALEGDYNTPEQSRPRAYSATSTGTDAAEGDRELRPAPFVRSSSLLQSSFNSSLNGSHNVAHFVGSAWHGEGVLEEADAGGLSSAGTQTDPNDLVVAGVADTYDDDWYKGSVPSLHGSFMASTSVLIDAARFGQKDKLKVLSEVIDVNAKDAQGRSALMHACVAGHVHVVKFLLEKNADLNYALGDGSTAIHYAASAGNPDILTFLIAQGADALVRDAEGRTPLHWATLVDSTKGLKVLLKHLKKSALGSLDTGDLIGMTALMFCAYHCRAEHGALLLKAGADPTIRDADGRAAIHHAVAHKFDLGCLPLLLNLESSKWRDAKGKAVIHYAAEQGAGRACRLIASLRADSVHDTDLKLRTPLQWAAACGQAETVRILLEANANANHVDADGYRALDYASAKKYHYCYLLLSAYGQTKLAETVQAAQLSRGDRRRESSPDIADDSISIATEGSRVSSVAPQLTSSEYDELFRALMHGCYLLKFPEDGKGQPHRRYFAVDVYSGRIMWGKAPEDVDGKAETGDAIVDISPHPSKVIRDRKDYDPQGRHKLCFSIQTTTRHLDLIAASQAECDAWLYGVRGMLSFGARVIGGNSNKVGGVLAARRASKDNGRPAVPQAKPAGLTQFFESVERAERERALSAINDERKRRGLPPIRDEAWNSAHPPSAATVPDESHASSVASSTVSVSVGAGGSSAPAHAHSLGVATETDPVHTSGVRATSSASFLGTSAQLKAMVDSTAMNRIDETMENVPARRTIEPLVAFPKPSSVVLPADVKHTAGAGVDGGAGIGMGVDPAGPQRSPLKSPRVSAEAELNASQVTVPGSLE